MDYYGAHHNNATLTCRYFGISRQTFYRWKRRYDPRDLTSLEERSHRPRRLRQPTWSRELALAVLHLREQYPRWGKDKLVVLLRRQGWQLSTSMVGRILSYLKVRGVLREPLRTGISTRKRLWRRPYAVRKPKGYPVQQPGDLVQLDTLDVRPVPGIVLKHFTARDVVSRWDVVEAHTRATATTAAGFLERLLERMPFPVKAIQGIPWYDPDIGRGGLRRVVSLVDIPRGPGALDDLVSIVVDLPPGSENGPQVSDNLGLWGLRHRREYRTLLNLPYWWHIPGQTVRPVGRRADGKGRHWQRATDPDRYPAMSDDELVDIVFPTSGRARVSNLVGEARQVLKNLERAGELRIIEDKVLPPLIHPLASRDEGR